MMQRIYPYLLYENMNGTPEFLAAAFGLRRVEPRVAPEGHHRHGHVEMELEDGSRIRLNTADDDYRSPKSTGYASVMLQIDFADLDAHFARAKDAGATIVKPPHDDSHGERRYIADDLEGQRWCFIESAFGSDDE
jgi:PhnB protein